MLKFLILNAHKYPAPQVSMQKKSKVILQFKIISTMMWMKTFFPIAMPHTITSPFTPGQMGQLAKISKSLNHIHHVSKLHSI